MILILTHNTASILNINTYYEYNNAKTCKYLDSPSNLEDKQNTHGEATALIFWT